VTEAELLGMRCIVAHNRLSQAIHKSHRHEVLIGYLSETQRHNLSTVQCEMTELQSPNDNLVGTYSHEGGLAKKQGAETKSNYLGQHTENPLLYAYNPYNQSQDG
jgi:hypothetical protein